MKQREDNNVPLVTIFTYQVLRCLCCVIVIRSHFKTFLVRFSIASFNFHNLIVKEFIIRFKFNTKKYSYDIVGTSTQITTTTATTASD